jgi:hypothetical protein
MKRTARAAWKPLILFVFLLATCPALGALGMAVDGGSFHCHFDPAYGMTAYYLSRPKPGSCCVALMTTISVSLSDNEIISVHQGELISERFDLIPTPAPNPPQAPLPIPTPYPSPVP